MQPRSRIRRRDPPPPPSGGRYRRRSPSPRHHRRARDPPPFQPQRRSPERPRRQEEKPPPDAGAAERRSRADILLEAGRLAAHYLVAQGVLPEHLLRAREESKHNPSSRPEPPAAAGYVRKRDDLYHDDDPRWRRNGAGGDWGRDKGDDDRLSRRSGWDRRTQSFDGRRKHNDGGGGDVDPGGRRSHEYDEQRRAAMSRSYSHNDRRASGDGRVDRRRRSRSRSRTRIHYSGSRRDSDWRAGGSDLDHSKVPESATVRAGDGDVDYGDVDQVPRDLKAPCSVVVMEVNDDASHEDAEMESEVTGLDHGQDVCGDEDGENAVAGLNNAEIGEINVTQHQLSNVGVVHPSDSVEEPVHMQSQLNDVEGDMEAGIARRDVCLIEPVAENSGFSEVRDEMEAPQSEAETDVGDLTRDEQELPAWYGIFDLNVIRAQESCEMSDISGDSPADHACDSVPDLVGRMGQRANYDISETKGQDEHSHENHELDDIQMLPNQGIGTHDLNKYDPNNGQRLLNQKAEENAQDNRPLKNEQMHLNHSLAAHDLDNCHLTDEEMLLKQDADEQEDHNHQTENEQMPLNQSTAVQALDNYHMNGKRLLLNHGADEHPDNNHQMENEKMLLHHVTGVHDLDYYDLNSEQILQRNGTDKPAAGSSGQLKDEQMLLDQAADGQAALHNMGIRQMIPVINLEDDHEEQSDTKEFLVSKSDTLHKHVDNVLPEHMYCQDQQTSSFPDHPQTNIPAAASSSVTTPNFANRWTGRGAVNAQGIPSDDDVLYVAFDKIPLEVINVWDLPSSELGKSS